MTEVEPSGNGGGNERELLLQFLGTCEAHCPLCKYNLRHLTEPRCPECGRELRLAVGLREPLLWPMITMLVSLSMAAGCGVLALVLIVTEWARNGHSPGFHWKTSAIIMFYGSILSIPAALVCMLRYRRFMRWPVGQQKMWAVAAVAWDAALFAVFLGLATGIVR